MALFVTVTLPVVLVFWLVIHGGIRLWRRLGTGAAYVTATLAMVVTMLGLSPFLEQLLGADLGTRPLLAIPGALIYALSIFASAPVRRSLRFRTFIGLQELEGESEGLLVGGPYRYVRHPRYLMVIVGIVGWALVCNYAGTYLLSAAAVIGFCLIAALEEKELEERYGERYEAYRERVPMLLPGAAAIRAWLGAAAWAGRSGGADDDVP
jgi:protein-S-isoprenylcysteine O-methyltransferase Ste14